MKHIPILFSTPMVQANLIGTKNMTRRLNNLDSINANPNDWEFARFYDGYAKFCEKHNYSNEKKIKCPYGNIGDILWQRETFMHSPNCSEGYTYKASVSKQFIDEWKKCWKPSIHMPKEACRAWYKITNIRVERLQDITEEDAVAEGIEPTNGLNYNYCKNYLKEGFLCLKPIASYRSLWISINGIQSWELNPFVWVIEYEPTTMPIYFLKK